MYPSVLAGFRDSLSNEGYTRYMYLDDRGLVTTGQGDLIDPMEDALALPWQEVDGSLAEQYRIESSWRAVKAHQELAPLGGGSPAFQRLTSIRLSDAAVTALVTKKAESFASILEQRLPCITTAPADAQLALLRWAWGNGPSAEYPLMFAAIERGDYAEAAVQSEWKNETAAVKGLLNLLFTNAAAVREQGLDPSVLYWPLSPSNEQE